MPALLFADDRTSRHLITLPWVDQTRCGVEIQEYIDAGATKFVMRPYGPREMQREQVRILAKEVIPALQTPFSAAERAERLG